MILSEQKWRSEFNSDERIQKYDAVINLLALRRNERFRVLHTLLPAPSEGTYHILDLGSGTGVVTKQLITRYPNAIIFAVDGSRKMIDYARSKKFFQKNRGQLSWILADYSSPAWQKHMKRQINLVISFDALHHLNHQRKRALYQEIFEMILPGGMLIISDHMTSYEPFYDDPQFSLWIAEIRKVWAQSGGKNLLNLLRDRMFVMFPERFKNYLRPDIRENFINRLIKEGDSPMPIMNHVDALRDAGFKDVTVEYRFSHFGIISAFKSKQSMA